MTFCLSWACIAAVALTAAAQTRQPVDTAWLAEVEEKLLPPAVVHGEPRCQDLPAFYRDTNEPIVLRFERAKAALDSGSPRPFRMLTLVAGDAGIGKTFIKNAAFRKGYPKAAVCRFDIGDVYSQWKQQGIVEARPDLYAETPDGDDLVLSRLPAVCHDQPMLLTQYLASKKASIFLIDSLDEVHPDDCMRILQQVERFVFDGDRPFVHVVVLGRSIAFRDYWHERAGFYSTDLMNIYVVNAPRFETTGDLLVSTWNYHCFAHDLKWAAANGEAEQMPFEHYVDWAKAGYPAETRGRRVHYKPNRSMNAEVDEVLRLWATEHRAVNSMLRNLAGNGFIREIAERYALAHKPYDEEQVLAEYLDLWLERDTKSNDRPSRAKPEHLELYLRLLEAVAAKYAAKDRLTEEGYFEVRYDDVVLADVAGRQLRFPVYRILNRSGLKHSDPRHAGSRRYRFEPIWLHRHLVNRYNRRLLPESQARLSGHR